MTQPTLMFGLGAARAGTTWLYRYLSGHPECQLPAVKELHYFDTCETGQFDRQIGRMKRECARRVGRLPTGDARLDLRLTREMRAYRRWLEVLATHGDDAAYRRFILPGAGKARLAGDITPAYATLSEASLQRMAGLAGETRFVFLIRDPLDRLWSNIRLSAARARGVLEVEAARMLDRALEGRDATVTARSDYAGTLARLDAALDPAQLFVGFYERLFEPATLDRLCAFLGIAPKPAPVEQRVLASEALEMSAAQRARALNWLAPQYEAVAARRADLPPRWRENMEVLA